MTKLVSVATAFPKNVLSLETVRRELSNLIGQDAELLPPLNKVIDTSGVKNRFLVCPVERLLRPRPLEEKTEDFVVGSKALGLEVTKKALDRAGLAPKDIDLIVTVSCTGFMIPSLDAFLMNELGFSSSCRRLPITELGCAGGAAAISMAKNLLSGLGGKHALVVAVELPSLTLQLQDLTMSALISAILFGDGAAAVVLSNDEGKGGAEILDTKSHLFPNSTRAMGFDLRDSGFHIVLQKDVPEIIRDGLPFLTEELFTKNKVGASDIGFYAFHPGGRKILEFTEASLGVPRDALSASWQILAEYGNLSSASVLAVYERELTLRPPRDGEYGLMAAFGPGFSAEMLLLKWVRG